MQKTYDMVDWNIAEDDYSDFILKQLKALLWFEDEFTPSQDKDSWDSLTDAEQDTYKKVLGGLTLLDTFQGGDDGIGNFIEHIQSLQKKSVFRFMEFTELVIHAKSYSNIFMTIATNSEIDEVKRWVKDNEFIQYKANRIAKYYKNIKTKRDLYLALVASCFLEGVLFYSGFFYPLFLSGQGKMVYSSEIIKKIMLDENIHSIYTGMVAQEIYNALSEDDKVFVDSEIESLLYDLYENELRYTQELYSEINLTHEVKTFLRYNINKVFMNIGKEPIFEHEEINPIVNNAINTQVENIDFFSSKGFGYQKAIVKPITGETFTFDWLEK